MKFSFAVWALALLPLGCSKDESKSTSLEQGSLAGQTFYVVEASDLEHSDTAVKGSGAVVFASPLDSITSKDDYSLHFTVDDGGSLELITHSNSRLENGISVVFARSGSTLSASLKTSAAETSAIDLSGVDASGAVTLAVDVHNDETPAHILIWSEAGGSFGAADALLNSEEGEAAPGKGTGTAWGLHLNKAQVSSALVRDPKFVE